MSKLFAILVLVLLLAPLVFAGIPTTAGVLTNPTANTLLADTGNINDGQHELTIILSSSVAAVIIFEHRNAGDTANVYSQAFLVPANGTVFFKIEKFVTTIIGESFRLRLNTGVTGTMQGSILVD